MKRHQPKSIGEVIGQYLQENNLEKTLLEHHVVEKWEEVIGPQLARFTSNPEMRNGTLYVHIPSAPLRQEFFIGRKEIIRRLNDAVGATVVKDIRLLA